MAFRSLAAAAVILAGAVSARTDLTGCTYYDSVVVIDHVPSYNTRIWYVPGSGELCDFIDCGGGRAPPKTTVPGCPLYTGTATYSPSFIDLKTIPEAGGTSQATSAPKTTILSTATSGPPTDRPAQTTQTTQATQTAPSSSGSAEETDKKTTESGSGSVASPSTTLKPSGETAGAASSGTKTSSTALKTSSKDGAAAAPTAGAILGSCLVAGIAACVGLL